MPTPPPVQRCEVRLGDDLNQRSAAPIEIDKRGAGAINAARLAHVDHLRRVLLKMGAVDAHLPEPTGARQGGVVLADLVGLRAVGIKEFLR